MICDSSAIVAIIRREANADTLIEILGRADVRRISAANYVEAATVLDRVENPILSRRFDELLQDSEITIESVTEAQARIAREAYRDFGKGSGHRAKLNYGDCFAYALAKHYREPLLFVGRDFTFTDVTPALRSS